MRKSLKLEQNLGKALAQTFMDSFLEKPVVTTLLYNTDRYSRILATIGCCL